MKQTFVTTNNLQIACYIANPGQVNTIFFIHGNSSSSRVWRKQIESPSLADYRLITIDLPSHGNSDALPADADSSLPAIATIMAEAVKQLVNDKPFIICGSSLGTNIVAEMLTDNFSLNGLLMAGPCIVGEGFELDKMILPGANVTPVFAENVPAELVNKYAGETSISTDTKDRQIFLEDYHAVKDPFRSALYATIAAGIYSDEIAILQKNNCPICIIFGKDERVVNNYYLDEAPINVWNKIIYKIPQASHLVNIDAPEAFNELLVQFAKEIFTTGAA